MATSPKDKFDAAVKVIRGLPKNGSFQPSHELMLKFYSYFKQATEGPCTSPKPGFWDLVNRKKWDAWAKLGNMDPEEAMLLYVDELKNVSKKIVETMPQTDDVSEFLQKLDYFYEMVEDRDVHNSLEVNNKHSPPATNSSVSSERRDELPPEQSLNGSADFGCSLKSEYEQSQGVAQLLQQDLRWWQDRAGIIRSHKSNGGITSEARMYTSHGPLNGNTPDFQDVIDNDNDEDNDKRQGNGDTPGTESTEEWEEVQARASNSGSHSGQSGGSASDTETENEEEFCDTSDEPNESHVQNLQEASAELAENIRTSLQAMAAPGENNNSINIVKFSTGASVTSTTAGNKYVHFNEPDGRVMIYEGELHASRSSLTAGTMSEADIEVSTSNHNMHWDSSYDAGVGSTTGMMDISMCRGGEGDGGDKDRRAMRGAGYGGTNSAMSGRGGFGARESSGSSGGHGSFPGPGGGAGGGGGGGGPGGQTRPGSVHDLNEQIVVTLLRLQHDMSGVLNRLNSLEALVKEGRAEKERRSKAARGWWPLSELSVKSALIIVGWPILLQIVLFYLNRRRSRRPTR